MSTDTTPLSTDDALTRAFEADPLTLTDAEIDTHIVIELRRRRNAFLAKEATDKLKPKRERVAVEPQTPAEAAKLDKPAEEISLADLLDD